MKLLTKLSAFFQSYMKGLKHAKYMDTYELDLKCPHCQLWSSEVNPNIGPAISSIRHVMAVKYNCAGCNLPSYWVCEAGFWFPASEFGISDKECQESE